MNGMDTVAAPVCDEKMKRLEDRINGVETITQEIHKLTISVERLAITVQNMVTEQESQRKRLTEIESRDGDLWRTLLKYVITAVAGIAIGYAFKNIGF